LYTTNQNTTIQAEKISNPLLGTSSFTSVSDRVLTADATLSTSDPAGGGNSGFTDANRYQYNFNFVLGGFPKTGTKIAHLSPHLNGRFPRGGNIGFKDGHVEWRKFEDMFERADPNKSANDPAFWW
jgi:prepilin-type processing-associated H-X9-DG protein